MSSGELVSGAIIRSKYTRARRRLVGRLVIGDEDLWIVETLGTYPSVYTIPAVVVEHEWVVEDE